MWELIIIALIMGAVFIGIKRWIDRQWEKAAKYDPAQGRAELPDISGRTLDETLTYMSCRPGLLVWDILWGCAMVSMSFAFWGETARYQAIMRAILWMGGLLVGGHIIFTIYYHHHSYRKKMIKATGKFLNIGNEEMYCEALEQNLMEKMIYRSMWFVVSEDYIIGYLKSDISFHPVAIPICTIMTAEYYLEHHNTRPKRTIGYLSCKLSNGNVVEFCTSQGWAIEKIPKVLDYCGIIYTCR